jgi:hypothetical protein
MIGQTINVLFDGSRVYRRTADVVCRQVGPESILVPVRSNVGNLDFVYTLSAVAARIWALLDGTRNLGAIVDIVCSEYDIDHETATADVIEMIGRLEEAALIARGEP